jgi:hypothetical protein
MYIPFSENTVAHKSKRNDASCLAIFRYLLARHLKSYARNNHFIYIYIHNITTDAIFFITNYGVISNSFYYKNIVV